ncbi:hypothetical protein MMC11_005458 [Xylographa trunciseda]|nr:hypothetical protein [Xylographa trunciseda]
MASQQQSAIERLEQQLREEQQEEQQARQEAELRNQKTTFSEFLQACHEYLHKPLGVETDESLTTKGLTSPKSKYYPKTLRPWVDFPQAQQDLFRIAHALYHIPDQTAPRLFNPLVSVEDLGRDHCQVRLANETSLQNYEKVALEVPVAKILNHLCDIPQAEEQLDLKLGQGITFQNNPNSLRDTEQEVQERLQESPHIQSPRTPPPRFQSSHSSDPDSSSNAKQSSDRTRADQYCVYKNIEGKHDLLFIVEYKPPHKLSAGDLQRGFREMDLKDEVIDRTTIPPPIPVNNKIRDVDTARVGKESRREKRPREEEEAEEAASIDARLQYNADKLIAAIATQTFHYMIENGLEYSYITTGEAFVFLRVLLEDPRTLYYHVTVPVDEINDGDLAALEFQTAVAQVAVLCLMALRTEQRDHDWRTEAKVQLKVHPSDDYETILLQTPDSERQLGRQKKGMKSPLYKGERKGLIKSDFNLRSWDGKGNPHEPREPRDGGRINASLPSNPSGTSGRGATNSGSQSGRRQKDGSTGKNNQASSSSTKGKQRQYCTQKCLLGVTRGLPLDGNCPNAALHPELDQKHAINISEFLYLVQKQLGEHVDHYCEPLGLQGARGTLFKITLASHGYVFVGKGTVYAFVPDLLHEGRVYHQLEAIQGTAVPVCLGNIDLLQMYYLDLGVRISHMILMSWGGTTTDKSDVKETSGLQAEIQRTVAEVQREGIDQADVRRPNLLWNREAQRVMLIDFERAQSMVKELPLQDVSPNKRRNEFESPVREMRRKALK